MQKTNKYAAGLTLLTFAFLLWLSTNYGEKGLFALVGLILLAGSVSAVFLMFKLILEEFWEGVSDE